MWLEGLGVKSVRPQRRVLASEATELRRPYMQSTRIRAIEGIQNNMEPSAPRLPSSVQWDFVAGFVPKLLLVNNLESVLEIYKVGAKLRHIAWLK